MICSRINLNNVYVFLGFDYLNIIILVKLEKLLCGSICIGIYFYIAIIIFIILLMSCLKYLFVFCCGILIFGFKIFFKE